MTTALFLLLVALFAWAEVKHDDRLIDEGKPIDHFSRWGYRAMLALFGCAPFAAVGLKEGYHERDFFIPLALLLVAAGALFSCVFRLLLNRRRKLPWWYLSASNYYDRFFLWLAHVWPGAIDDDEWKVRAGRIQYAFEILVTLAALIGVAVSNN